MLTDKKVYRNYNSIENEYIVETTSPKGHKRSILIWSILLIVVVIVVIYGSSSVSSDILSISSSSNNFEENSVKFTLRRKGYNILPYFNLSSLPEWRNYKFLEDYIGIIEPYQSMHLYIFDDPGYEYSYSICLDEKECIFGYWSSSDSRKVVPVSLACTPHTKFVLTVNVIDLNGDKINTESGNVICLYIRRELRSLSTDDISQSLDAMYTLWTTSEEEGQIKYGKSFHNSTYFSKLHHFNAAWQDADHIHEGSGFLSQHLKITNMFERGMQAVDPSVSLFYWDYTMDIDGGLDIYQSPMFTNETFGSLTKPHNISLGWSYRYDNMEDARISNGRWKDLNAEKNVWYPELMQGYKYMRAPWNTNPNPYISRFSTPLSQLPTCERHRELIVMKDFPAFMYNSSFRAHGSTHIAISGWFGCDILDPLRERGTIVDFDEQIYICLSLGFVVKEMYRAAGITVNKDCQALNLTREGLECGYNCTNVSSMRSVMGIMFQSAILTVSNISDAAIDDWVDFFCNGEAYKYTFADHLESASAADPSFWPIHGTLERLYHATLLSGAMVAEDWGRGLYCQKKICWLNGERGAWPECCRGHYYTDQLLDYESGDRYNYIGDSNQDVIEAGDPTSKNYSMPYIYDDFDWSHCTTSDLNLQFEVLRSEYLSSITSSIDASSSINEYFTGFIYFGTFIFLLFLALYYWNYCTKMVPSTNFYYSSLAKF